MEHRWPETHAEQTDVLEPVRATRPDDEPTVRFDRVRRPEGRERKEKRPDLRSRVRRAGIIAGAVVAAFVALYGVDLWLSSGKVPRGVTVAGVEVGGESRADAERTLREAIEPRLHGEVEVQLGDVSATVRPEQAGLSVDWAATLARAGDQPLNPITRLTSLFTTQEVGVATITDDAALTKAIEALRAKTDREPAEGAIRFDGLRPVAVEPKPGQKLDVDAARRALVAGWTTGDPVTLPVRTTPVTTTPEDVARAIKEIATPAVSGPVVVHGKGRDATLKPGVIAKALRFTPADGGGLTATLDHRTVVAALHPQLASTEEPGKDARIVFDGGRPTVRPSVAGTGVDWKKSLAPAVDVLRGTEGRELTAAYGPKPAEVTTAGAKKLGIKEVIGEFTTSGFAADSGANIRTVAEEVDGAIVRPGKKFSLNGHTGPRTEAQGYVEAGVIENGAPSREVGGGISQFATTLYNAAYFAAMTDAGHQEHSYYISRYPEAREATVFQNPDGSSVIDLAFTNDSSTGVAIQTVWTPESITVKLWGTKHYEVESTTGERTAFTDPETRPGPAENCHASTGGQGFTTSDTRIIRDAKTGAEVSRRTRHVSYNPHPKIVCP